MVYKATEPVIYIIYIYVHIYIVIGKIVLSLDTSTLAKCGECKKSNTFKTCLPNISLAKDLIKYLFQTSPMHTRMYFKTICLL